MDFSLFQTHEILGYVLEHGFFPEGKIGVLTFVLECLRVFRDYSEDYTNDAILEIAEHLGVTFPLDCPQSQVQFVQEQVGQKL